MGQEGFLRRIADPPSGALRDSKGLKAGGSQDWLPHDSGDLALLQPTAGFREYFFTSATPAKMMTIATASRGPNGSL